MALKSLAGIAPSTSINAHLGEWRLVNQFCPWPCSVGRPAKASMSRGHHVEDLLDESKISTSEQTSPSAIRGLHWGATMTSQRKSTELRCFGSVKSESGSGVSARKVQRIFGFSFSLRMAVLSAKRQLMDDTES